MRLKEYEHNAIITTVQCHDPAASVYLFGSRVDDSKRGGDIDLLVITDKLSSDDMRSMKMRLSELLGEQKIDLVMAADDTDPFVRIALTRGVKL